MACAIDKPVGSRDEWWARECHYWIDDHAWYWGRATHRTKERARMRDVTHTALQWHRGDPESFAENFDHGPHTPWRDYWID